MSLALKNKVGSASATTFCSDSKSLSHNLKVVTQALFSYLNKFFGTIFEDINGSTYSFPTRLYCPTSATILSTKMLRSSVAVSLLP